jgi:hypothetical protein
MPAVQLHCPHCGGLFQIDDSLGGQHVGCPLCASVVAIPELHPAPAAGPPPPPPPEFAGEPPAEEAYQLGCPHCGGLFQVTQAMGGQEISCPHCYTAVLLPELGSPPPSLPQGEYVPYPPEAPSPFESPPFPAGPAPSVGAYSEPGPADLWNSQAPQGATEPAFFQPAPFEPAPSQPAFQPAPLQTFPAPQAETAGETLEDLLPPGAVSRKAEKEPKPRAEKEKSLPDTKKKKAKKPVAPAPTEPAATDVDELLPPGAPSKKEIPEQKREVAEVEELLPPAVETPKKNAPIPLGDDGAGRKPGVAADGSVLIPTDDGQLIALREPVKTVEVQGREIELRRLTPEEKEQRRFRRNLFVAGFGLLFLIVTMIIMALAGGI